MTWIFLIAIATSPHLAAASMTSKFSNAQNIFNDESAIPESSLLKGNWKLSDAAPRDNKTDELFQWPVKQPRRKTVFRSKDLPTQIEFNQSASKIGGKLHFLDDDSESLNAKIDSSDKKGGLKFRSRDQAYHCKYKKVVLKMRFLKSSPANDFPMGYAEVLFCEVRYSPRMMSRGAELGRPKTLYRNQIIGYVGYSLTEAAHR